MYAHVRSRLAATLPRWPIVALLAMVAFLGGCSGNSAVVSGTVRYKGELLTTGEVSLIADGGKSRSGLIGDDGSYQINDAPVGPVRVVVIARRVQGGPTGESPVAARLAADRQVVVTSLIPTRYGDPATSGLNFEIVAGKQIHDLDLKD
jgi:hypothetical protein